MIGARGSAPHAVAGKGSSIPGVIAEDAVSLGDDMPPLNVMEIGSVGVARLDVLGLELCS